MSQRITITLSDDIFAWLKIVSFYENRNFSNFIEHLLYNVQEQKDKKDVVNSEIIE